MPNFKNRTMWTGDNLDIMRGMNSESVDLIYLDPPFNSNRTYAAPVGSKAAGAAFKDSWSLSDLDVAWMGIIADKHPAMYKVLEASGITHGKGMQSYLCMMGVRIIEMHRLLKNTGSLYLHCDPTASHYLKLLMDAVFGPGNFKNEITWCYKRMASRNQRHFSRCHDVLLCYEKTPRSTFNPDSVRLPYSESSKRRAGHKKTSLGGAAPASGVCELNARGRFPEDWWDIPIIRPNAKERVGYPTQKPLALLDRIIQASSNTNDMVLDPFCGCATALVSADKMNRQWVGIDISHKASELVNIRLQSELGDLYHSRLVTVRTDVP